MDLIARTTNRQASVHPGWKITFAFLLCVLAGIAPVSAQQPLSIKGPTVVSACQLVRLDVEMQDDESALWIVEPSGLDYEQVGNRLIFTLGCQFEEVRLLVVAASIQEGNVRFRQMRHIVRLRNPNDSQPGDKPPGPSKPPKDGEPTPVRQWNEITQWISTQSTPTIDKETANRFATQLLVVAEQIKDMDLQQATIIAGNMRREIFQSRPDASFNWNDFLLGLDRMIAESPPKDTREYRGLLVAISKGLTQKEQQ